MKIRNFITISCLFLFYSGLQAQWNGFKLPLRVSTYHNHYLVAKDITGDHFPDIAISNVYLDNSNSFSLLVNNKKGGYVLKRVTTHPGYAVWDAGDVNNDSIPDLLSAAYWENGIRLYQGTGNEQFDEGIYLATSTHGGASAMYDMDGDKNLDFVSISSGSGNPIRLHIFRGRGDGTFLPKYTCETNFSTGRRLNICDINNDNRPDVVISASFTKIISFVQNPDFTFTANRLNVEDGESFDNKTGDVNNDDIIDIVYGGGEFAEFADTIRILTGKGDGTFNAPYSTSELSTVLNPINIELADVNQDKNLDILTFDSGSKNLYYFIGNGNGTFQHPVMLVADSIISNFKITDVDLDHFPDIVTVNKNNTSSVFLNYGIASAVSDQPEQQKLSLYPNPFVSHFYIKFNGTISHEHKFQILDNQGRIVNASFEKTGEKSYRCSFAQKLPAGIYFIKTIAGETITMDKIICTP